MYDFLQMEEGTAVRQTTSRESMESVLAQQIAENPQLVRGRLENGLEYVILPNETPPTRFEAHLEVHAGKVWRAKFQSIQCHLRLTSMLKPLCQTTFISCIGPFFKLHGKVLQP